MLSHQTEKFKMRYFERGMSLANSPTGEEVVITGMAGRFPSSNNIYELRDNLANKKDLITDDDRRWNRNHPEIPHRAGKINDIEKFDAGFFGMHFRQAYSMDPNCRMILERAYEAIMDAGFNPEELRGTKTGVFIGTCFSESENALLYKQSQLSNYSLTGCTHSMQAQWISYIMGLEGPSNTVDSACSSSLYAINYAYEAIRLGRCDAALVGSTNLCMHPTVSLQLARLGVLSKDGVCKCFDAAANGYVRSEGNSIVFLQKAKNAKRVYAQIIHCKANCDGFKEQGITFPSYKMQKQLFKEMYNECQADPASVDFIEAHATGTQAGDPEEIMAIDEVFCTNRKTPFPIGSVKSNIGHTEASSGLCSIIKVLVAMENDCLLPNIHYKNPIAEAAEKRRLIVVTENMPWPKNGSGLAAINSFGFGGANCHLLLKRWTKRKKSSQELKTNLPRLVCVSGRTEAAIKCLLDDFEQHHTDVEYLRILHDVFKNDIPAHLFRGFSIIDHEQELHRSSKRVSGIKQPLCLVFGGVNDEVLKMSKHLLRLPLFEATIQKINNISSVKGINMYEMINKCAVGNIFADVLVQVAVYISLIDIFKTLNVYPNSILGYSLGRLVTMYGENSADLKQTVSASICVANVFKNTHEEHNTNKNKIRIELLQNFQIIFGHKSSVPESLTNAILKTTLPDFANLPPKTVLLEIGTSIVQFRNVSTLSMLDPNFKDPVVSLLTSLGRLYEMGYNPKIHELYPPIEWPVSVGTPMLSPLIKWNHEENWFVPLFTVQGTNKSIERNVIFSAKDTEWAYVTGNVIDGRNLMPATGYLVLIWETISLLAGLPMSDQPVVFENIKFIRASTIPKNLYVSLFIMIQKSTGSFEIREKNHVIVSGKVKVPESCSIENLQLPPVVKEDSLKLTSTDIYKELMLRGYNYKEDFRGIKSCNLSASIGMVEWKLNWVTFMDNMLQLRILQQDTRSLHVPTTIDWISIDPGYHIEYAGKFGENPTIPVYSYEKDGIIRSGGIEIRGLMTTSIARCKPTCEPVLEIYKFVPFEGKLPIRQAIRVQTQIVLENTPRVKIRAVEVANNHVKEASELLSPFLYQAFTDHPIIQPDLIVLSQHRLDLNGITVNHKTLASENKSCTFVIASKVLQRPQVKNQAMRALKEDGAIISREDLDCQLTTSKDLEIVAAYQTDEEQIVLLRKSVEYTEHKVINVSDVNFDWLSPLKSALNKKEKIILLSQEAPTSGVMALGKCLKRESPGGNVKCVFITDKNAPVFNPQDEFFHEQLKKGLTMNVLKDGKWGTYRHLLLQEDMLVEREHVFCNVTTRGDLTSVRWIEGPLTAHSCIAAERILVHIYYSALNFRDIMTATGTLTDGVITKDRLGQDNVKGLEFSGRTSSGQRIMGITNSGGLSSLIAADSNFIWSVPDDLPMEDAVTIPLSYCTVLYAFVLIAKIKRGQSVLIHTGSGGVGQAAINVALYYNCKIFTTVGTEKKTRFIRETFPRIPESHIGNSRDTSFEQMVHRKTNGRGVDIVLNSLTEEKLLASVRCLAPGGCFLEIGKFDLTNNNLLGLTNFTNGRSFHGIMLDSFFSVSPSEKLQINRLLQDGLINGMIKPLAKTIFAKEKVEEAFLHMACGKHIGKIVIKMRNEEPDRNAIPKPQLFKGWPRVYADPQKSYIVCGGTGGFGLEVSDWLVTKGARNLILVSRSGLTNGYQASRLRIWKSYGASIIISSTDITTEKGCEEVLKEAAQLGPVDGIFNLAMAWQPGLIEDQTEETFKISLAPKAFVTKHFDKLTRKMCPKLRYFVVFSSITSGRGYIGQTNYGMANSIMERICEQRKNAGYPALAIQWGPVGDVGVLMKIQGQRTEKEIGGTLQQGIVSCLEVMNLLLEQDEPVVSSMIVAKKRNREIRGDYMIDTIREIMCLGSLKTISLHALLAELGMDSMMAIEIKQCLEREYDVFLTAQEIRNLTFAKLLEISEQNTTEIAPKNVKGEENEKLLEGFNVLYRNMGDEANSTIPITRLESMVREKIVSSKIFLLPGVEGMSNHLEPLASSLESHVYCLQFTVKDQPESTVEELARTLLPRIQENESPATPFTLIGYSFGCIVTLELASLLEAEGRIGRVFLIDGSPAFLKELTMQILAESNIEPILETEVLCALLQLYLPPESVMRNRKELLTCKSLDERINLVINIIPESVPHSEGYQRRMCYTLIARIKSVLKYQPQFAKIKSMVKLLKSSQPMIQGFAEDYKLQDLCENPVEVMVFEGNHLSIIRNSQIGHTINNVMKSTRGTKAV